MSDAKTRQKTSQMKMADFAPDEIEWIDGYPTPPAPGLRPFHAVASVLKLLRNKEDTSLVFEAIAAMSGRSGKRLFARFVETPYGKRVIEAPVRLEEVLADREALRALPEGTLGRAYLAFMEGENLTAEGLIDAAAEAGIDFRSETDFEAYRRLFLHLDVSHDLWHVVTGYGRDALGELCNLVFTMEQTRNRGFLTIIVIGAIAQKLEQPRAKIISSLMEARRNARAARWILAFDVEALLKTPLGEARRMVGLGPTPVYDSVPENVKRSLLKPKAAGDAAPGAQTTPAQ